MGDLSGSWLCSNAENMEKFMEVLGVSWMMRKAASGMGFGVGKQANTITNGAPGSPCVTVVNKDPTGKETTSELKTDGTETTAEGPFGSSGKVKAHWEGAVLVAILNDGSKEIGMRREVVGDKLELTMSCKGVTAKRVFSKQ